MTRDWDALVDEEYLGLHVRHPRRHREEHEEAERLRELERLEANECADVDEGDFR